MAEEILIGVGEDTYGNDGSANYLNGHLFTCSKSGSLTQIRVKADADAGVYAGVYNSSKNLLASCGGSVVSGWNTLTLDTPINIVKDTQYYIMAVSNNAKGVMRKNSGLTMTYKSYTYKAVPSTLGTVSTYASRTYALAGWGLVAAGAPMYAYAQQ